MKLKTSVTLDAELATKLKAEATRQRRSMSQLVEIWLEDMLFFRGEAGDLAPSRRGMATPTTTEEVV